MVVQSQTEKTKVILLGRINSALLVAVVLLALSVVYSTHVSRVMTAQQSQLQTQIEELQIRHDQLLLEEGTFARTAIIARKATKNLHMQDLILEQVVRVIP